jgi:hypothetical protein
MKARFFIFSFAVLLSVSCRLIGKDYGKKDPEDMYVRTPQGYWVHYVDYGSIKRLGGIEKIYEIHAQAVDRACRYLSYKYKWPIGDLQGMAKGQGYILNDHYKAASSSSPTGLVTGQWIPRPEDSKIPQVITCLYAATDGLKKDIPVDAPAWTFTHNPSDPKDPNDPLSLWRWGSLPASGGFPSLDHELGHAYTQDPRFEH